MSSNNILIRIKSIYQGSKSLKVKSNLKKCKAKASTRLRFFVSLSLFRKQNRCDFHAKWCEINLMPQLL